MTRRRVFNRALLPMLALIIPALAPSASAQVDGDAWDLIDAMPAEASVIVVIDDLSAVLASPAGQSLSHAITGSGFFRPTFHQWSELADRLGMAPGEAVNTLLGRRVVFVGRHLSLPAVGGDARGAWAMLIWIPERVEKRVRKSLALAPRTKVAGQPVLAAEHGVFSLALFMTRGADGRDQTILLLAPASDDSMLEPLIRSLVSLSAPENWANQGQDAPDARIPGMDSAFLHVSAKTPDGAAFLLAARGAPRGWEGKLRIEKPGDQRASFGQRPVSLKRFHALAPGALALVMESAPDRIDMPGDSGLLVSTLFADVPERFLRIMGGRALVMVERADPEMSGLCVSLASEATYPGDPVAEGDRAISALISPAPGSAPPEGAVEGQYPMAVRTASIKTSGAGVLGAKTQAAWAFSTPREDAQRWWALRLSPEGSRAHPPRSLRPFVDALAGETASAPERRPVALGLVRPSALLKAMGDGPWSALRPVESLAQFERISWSLALDPPPEFPERKRTTVLTGTVQIDMRLGEGLPLGAPGGQP